MKNDNRNRKRKRYKIDDVKNNLFYQMPKFIFEGEFKNLSNNARVLYSLLRDRHSLSMQNNWINEDNEVYLIYTRKKMQEMLCLADKTVKKTVDQLKEYGLIEEEHIGLNKANRIYLTTVTVENTGHVKSTIQETEDLRFKDSKKYDSRVGENTIQETEDLRPNNNNTNKKDFNKNNYNNINSINHSAEMKNDDKDKIDKNNIYSQYIDIIKNNIEYETIKHYNQYKHDDWLDDIVHLMAEICICPENKTISVNRIPTPIDVIKSRFLKINSEHIDYIKSTLNENTTNIGNIRSYLITTIYNAPNTIDQYYKSKVNHDLYGQHKER